MLSNITRVSFEILGTVFFVKWTYEMLALIRTCSSYCSTNRSEQYWRNLAGERYFRWAVVTGPTRGIGKNVSIKLASLGFSLVLVGRNPKKLNDCKWEISQFYPECRIITLIVDLATDFSRLPDIDELSSLDIAVVVNNAGVINEVPTSLTTSSFDTINQIVAVNCFTPAFILYHILVSCNGERSGPALVINMGSVAAAYPLPLQATYSASKHFISFLSTAVALELNHFRFHRAISIGVLTPSYVLTDMTAYWYKHNSLSCPSAERYVGFAFRGLGNILSYTQSKEAFPMISSTGWPAHEIQLSFMHLGGELAFSLFGLMLHKYRIWCLQ